MTATQAENDTLAAALSRARLSLRPPPKLALSTWAERAIRLPEGARRCPAGCAFSRIRWPLPTRSVILLLRE